MYFLDAIQFPFKSQAWFGKAVVGAIMLFIPIFGWLALVGYVMKITREVLSGNTELPEYDFGADFSRGLTAFLGSLIYEIPIAIIGILISILLGSNSFSRTLSSALGYLANLLLQLALARYVMTEDFNVFWDVGRNFQLIRDNVVVVAIYLINTIIFGFIAGIIIGCGFVLLILPGFLLIAMMLYAGGYLLARYAQELGLSTEKSKAKNFA